MTFDDVVFAGEHIDVARLDAQLAALAPAERACLGDKATPKRRADFAAGRRAAHRAIAALVANARAPFPCAAVVRTSTGDHLGEPVAVDDAGGALPFFVSITHAGSTALAAASRARLGIDLTPIEPRGASFVAEAFVDDDELSPWRALGESEAHAIARAFAAKEAALKWLGVGFGLPLLAVAVRPRVDEAGAKVTSPVLGTTLRTCVALLALPERRVDVELAWGDLDDAAVCVVVARTSP